MPPTASTHGEVAGHDACGFLSAEVSLDGETPRAHADEPVSPAATTVVIPRVAVVVNCRSTIVTDAV